MQVRAARIDELSRVFRLTHDLASGGSVTRHVVACKRDPKLRSGTHFVLEADNGEFLATLTAYRFAFPGVGTTIGLANLYVPEKYRHQRYGRRLLLGVLDDYEANSQFIFYLLSAIGAEFYERFGFRPLPLKYDAAPECVPMLRCRPEDWPRLSRHRQYLRSLMAFVD